MRRFQAAARVNRPVVTCVWGPIPTLSSSMLVHTPRDLHLRSSGAECGVAPLTDFESVAEARGERCERPKPAVADIVLAELRLRLELIAWR